MSSVDVIYETSLKAALEAAMDVYEVDGIPVRWNRDEVTRTGMFSIKEDGNDAGECQKSNDDQYMMEKAFFVHTSPIEMDAFYAYEEARMWSHP
jgi:hypothetical protein